MFLLPALVFVVIVTNAPPGAETVLEEQLSTLTPGNLPAYLVQFLFPGLGTAVVFILGALAAGSEYGWGTLETVLSQRLGRLSILSGKLLALGALLLLFVLAAFLSYRRCEQPRRAALGYVAPPPTAELLEGLGAGVLILILWAAFGSAFATLFKGTALAVGLGLIYAFAVEPVFAQGSRSLAKSSGR